MKMDPVQEMIEAFDREDVEGMKKMIEKHGVGTFHLTKFHYDMYSLYHWAARSSEVEFVIFLLNKGWDISEKDKERNSALHYAVWYNDINMAKVLIEHGIGIDRKNIFGETPFLTALKYESEECVELLYECGADPNEKDNVGRGMFYYFEKTNWEKWAPKLLQSPERLTEENLKRIKEKRLLNIFE